MSLGVPRGVVVRGTIRDAYPSILTREALRFIARLHRQFNERRLGLLKQREHRQLKLDAGEAPAFLKHTQHIRDGNWKGPSIPSDLADRRVEITGPVDRKMIINALNSGAKVFMADFEDSSSPTWENMIDGQVNLRDAINRTISFRNARGKVYSLKQSGLATLMVRPRGWHLDEAHILVDGEPVSGSLVDFGLFFFHNAANLLKRGSGPYFYLAKLESHKEARLWNDVFVLAQEYCDIPRGTIRATVLLETIMAAFEMDEILFELREHSAGMNCGRWDYIFSFIKKFRSRADLVLPDRADVGMNKPFMANYVELVIQTCHKRGVHAMGGMAAQIPVKGNPAANKSAFDKVRNDKLREVRAGHDGSWVAHPGLIPVAMNVFNDHMKTPNQIHMQRKNRPISEKDLLDVGVGGKITERGLRANVGVGLQYLEAWLRGSGCVPIDNLMEDAATAEISRSQIWQWIKHRAQVHLASGQVVPITKELVSKLLREELSKVPQGAGRKWKTAAEHYQRIMFSDHLADFMTSQAYGEICTFSDLKLQSTL